MNAKRLTTDAVLVALYVVLSYVSINLGFLKLSFTLFPIILCALSFGALDGVIVAAVASYLCQMLSYGFTATTVLWMLPPIVMALVLGLYARSKAFELTNRQSLIIIGVGCIIVTTLNTIVMLVDGYIYHYPVPFTFYIVAVRYVSSVVMTFIYATVMPKAIGLIRRSGVLEGR